ncbi:mechanosensitive ion channel family protein [Gilvimarinus agarilyticus]|uniref:mechanosensitive ion channel family protein n=1 Tax=Reichenbachiella TaxID=156993 RepID=UPI000E6D3EDE|nr:MULTISPECIES: mechanosensitive ion channel family protein [Reichenbachiella]MBU2884802.1 mechanosensitive ion channel family protein [Gilvimarinus agarilyticus]MBU2913680.1 mechanosensitive ion channel family protein [Reichenbachiella agariperforans]RJE74370.1 mechanosensitive ion channel protein MscS [Reichenbachiella sp. MSK19-1]
MEEIKLDKPLETIIGKLESWYDAFISMLPNMAMALIVFLFFLVLARLARKVFSRLFEKTSTNKALESLFSTIIYYTVMGLGLFIILGILKLQTAVTSLLAGVGVIGLALGFAFQDIAANFVSGIILAFRTPYLIGDIVEINGITGTVKGTNLRVTIIESFTGQETYVPNKEVLANPITNFSVMKKRRIDLSVGVSYAEDLDKVEEIVLEVFNSMDGVIHKDQMFFDYEEFGGSSINFNIRFWIEFPAGPGYLVMKTRAIKAIKVAFDKNDISIPFPIRTLDFGIKGGKTLSEMRVATEGDEKADTGA